MKGENVVAETQAKMRGLVEQHECLGFWRIMVVIVLFGSVRDGVVFRGRIEVLFTDIQFWNELG
jgi:hypothetical protein